MKSTHDILVMATIISAVLFGALVAKVGILLIDGNYQIGDCITLDKPSWIEHTSIYKIIDRERDNYHVLSIVGGDAGQTATVRKTRGNEFQVTFRGAVSAEIEKIFLKLKVVDCPAETEDEVEK
jgi:hypothetical protein